LKAKFFTLTLPAPEVVSFAALSFAFASAGAGAGAGGGDFFGCPSAGATNTHMRSAVMIPHEGAGSLNGI